MIDNNGTVVAAGSIGLPFNIIRTTEDEAVFPGQVCTGRSPGRPIFRIGRSREGLSGSGFDGEGGEWEGMEEMEGMGGAACNEGVAEYDGGRQWRGEV